MRNGGRQRGVTLIEASIVLAISGVVVGTTVPGMQRLLDSRRLGGTAAQLVADIQYARSEAVARNRPVRVSFHTAADASCYVIHTGAAAQCVCSPSGPAVCEEGADEIKTAHLPAAEKVSLQANVASMLFDPLHGTSTPTGTLRVIGARGHEVRHVVNLMGRVRSCTPSSAVAGYRAC